MRFALPLFLLLTFAFSPKTTFSQSGQQYLQYVNPFIGTGGHGHTFPGATAPFGFVQLSPDTRRNMLDWDGCSGYHYSDSTIYGFSHTHLSGTGVADYGDILVMPFSRGARLEPEEYASHFNKNSETAEPGYYAVTLDRERIKCEMTASEFVGVHRYTYPANREKGNLLIDLRHRDEVLSSEMEFVNDREMAGYRHSKSWAENQRLYFVMRFSKRISGSIVLDMNKNPREAAPKVNSTAIVALLDFYNDDQPLVVAVGLSPVSVEDARRRLDEGCADLNFDKVKKQTQAKWAAQLSKIEVEGGSKAQKTVFYTALYHTMVAPNQFAPDLPKGHRYTVFSLWDTYRALHPLHTLLDPERTTDFINTFLAHYDQYGRLPVWELAGNETNCMIGNHAIPVIADAYAKGIRGFDAAKALEAMKKSANTDLFGLKSYRDYGFVPAEREPESVSKTLEYAYDDWCIGQMAALTGQTATAQEYFQRSAAYRHLFDPGTGFFRAKTNGFWHTPFDSREVNFNYTEANAWQYRFAVPHDIAGLIHLFGGRERFGAQLDSLFTTDSRMTGRDQADITGLIGQYAHGNEPSHHLAYLYNYAGQPAKTQGLVRRIMDTQYANRPDGLSGNEDCGQMSAWLVLSALGIYPVCPGTTDYALGSPWFEKAVIHQPGRPDFVIRSTGASPEKPWFKSLKIIGKEWPKTYVSHEQLLAGGTLEFDMTDQPSTWGAAEIHCPKTALTGVSSLPIPFIALGERVFRGEQKIALGHAEPDAEVWYAIRDFEGNDGPLRYARYTHPFVLKNSGKLLFYAQSAGNKSRETAADFYKIPDGMAAFRYNTNYSPQYTAGGNDGLIDGLRGSDVDFRTGGWQGFQENNLDVVIDLGKSKKLQQFNARFMQDENAWIFYPVKVQFEISDDGKNFQPVGEVLNTVPATEKGAMSKTFTVKANGSGIKARYVRVIGQSLGHCPAWHKGAGYPCWVFTDEVWFR
ncbi:MAG: GH92 family glycosyl hydrolase [Saprospiraceae bacterium]|nr:GH92 family glycosyl hydrolase [Saprospiraceae bacterium]